MSEMRMIDGRTYRKSPSDRERCGRSDKLCGRGGAGGEGEVYEQTEQLHQPTRSWTAFVSNQMINGKRTHERNDDLQGN